MLAVVLGSLSVPHVVHHKKGTVDKEIYDSLPDTCVEESSFSWVHMDYTQLTVNNLGGAFDEVEPDHQYMEFSNVVTVDGAPLKLRITTENITTGEISAYRPSAKWINKTKSSDEDETGAVGKFGVINLGSPANVEDGDTFVDLKFCFLNDLDEEVKVKRFEFSILDIDTGKKKRDGFYPQECITATAFNNFLLSVPNNLSMEVLDDGFGGSRAAQFCSVLENKDGSLNNPTDPMNLTPQQKAITVVLNYTNTACFGLRFLNTCCSNKGRNFLFTGKTSVSPPVCKPPVYLHGDPMVKVNGKGQHFAVGEDLTTLLDWATEDGHFELRGSTFGHETSGAQWFRRIVVVQDGKELLDATAQNPLKHNGAIDVKLDRRGVKYDSPGPPKVANLVSTERRLQVSHTKKKSAATKDKTFDELGERLAFKAGGLDVVINSADAVKFPGRLLRGRFHHLNVMFPSGLPLDGTGPIAELAGRKELSDITLKMLASAQRMRKIKALAREEAKAAANADSNAVAQNTLTSQT